MSYRTGSELRRTLQIFVRMTDHPLNTNPFLIRNGGAGRDRTDDPLLAKQVLSQLSYGP